MMRTLFLLLMASLPLCGQELFSGVTREIFIAPATEERLLGNLTFQTPAGTQWVIVEALTQAPEQNIDLYVRFGRPVEIAGNGQVLADFRSESPAGPDEHVFLSPTGAPPLQNGLYFVAFVVRSLQTEIRLSVKATITRGGAATTRVISTFDNGDDEDWMLNFPTAAVSGATTGDSDTNLALDPEGFLRVSDFNGFQRDFLVAPPKFLSNLSGFTDPYFEYDFRYFDGGEPLFPTEIRLLGDGSVYQFLGEIPEAGKWIRIHVPLTSGAWRRISGNSSFTAVLQNVQRIEVSMEHAPGPETNDLDNFRFNGSAPAPPTGPGGPDLSDFETGVDGWTRNFPASPLPFASFGSENAAVLPGLGGNQSEGFLLLVDGGGRNLDFAVAPDKFIRGLADLDRPWYEFEYRRFEGQFPFFSVKLRMLGNGAVYEWDGIRPREMWDRYRVPINAQNWVHVEGPKDFDAMLRNVQRLELSMDHSLGFEVHGLDNFRLRTQYTQPVGPAIQTDRDLIEVSVATLDAEAVLEDLEVTATGAEVDWRAEVAPAEAGWLGLTRAAGSTPDQTQVIIDPAGLGPGVHQAEIVITATLFGVPERRVGVTLVIGADPRVPVLNPNGVIQAADPALPLSPGVLGSLFGVFLAPQERATILDADGRLPTEALGVELLVLAADGSLLARAPLLYLSPGQINFQMPYEAAGLTQVRLQVVKDGEPSNEITVALVDAAPGIFPTLSDASAVVNPDGSINSPEDPATDGAILTAYFTGAGVVQPSLPSGQAAPVEPLSFPAGPLRAQLLTPFFSAAAEVVNAAQSPGFVGLAQLSLRVPAGLAPGVYTLQVTVAGRVSNSVLIWLR